jgi:hypothetical protein
VKEIKNTHIYCNVFSLSILSSWFEFKKYIQCIRTFQRSKKEVMFLYGIGFKDLDVLRRLRPRKYKYKEYITTTAVDVLFLTNLTNMYVRIVEH